MSDVFQCFLNSGVHGRPWDPKSYCVAKVFHDVIETENDVFQHAEENMINEMRSVLQPRLSRPRIDWYLNYSPCGDCSDEIISFLEDMARSGVRIRLNIYCASLYNINRPSCLNGDHPSDHTLALDDDHRHNSDGLRRLQERWGVNVAVFSRQKWVSLAHLLEVPNFIYSEDRRREDALLRRDLEELTGSSTRRQARQRQRGGYRPRMRDEYQPSSYAYQAGLGRQRQRGNNDVHYQTYYWSW